MRPSPHDRTRYPRTRHLPWSPGATRDDVRLADLSGFEGEEVVVTEKLDGENTTLARGYTHARSLDSAHHPSRSWLKALHGRIGHRIPDGWRVCGENLYARHSVPYDDLPAYFFAFNAWDAAGRCVGWDATVHLCRQLGIPHTPVIWRGRFDLRALRRLTVDTERCEGFVVRTTRSFEREAFGHRVAKWVRRGHVTDASGVHWMHRSVVPNGLGPTAALWRARTGASVTAAELLAATGCAPDRAPAADLAPLGAHLDTLALSPEQRLVGLLGAALAASGQRLSPALPALAHTLPYSTARAAVAVAQLQAHLRRRVDDTTRRAGLTQLARSADLRILHAVSAWRCRAQGDSEGEAQVAWSELHAAEHDLLRAQPFAELAAGLAADLAAHPAPDHAWEGVVAALGAGRLRSADEARALLPTLAQRRRPGQVTVLVGAPGAGKSTWVAAHASTARVVSLDDLRAARGDRGDQSANAAVLRDALALLIDGLRAGHTLVWDATSTTRRQRALVLDKARRYHVPTRIVSLVTPPEVLRHRNRVRRHPVPDPVLDAMATSIEWPLAHEAAGVDDHVDGETHRFGGYPGRPT